VRGGDCKPAPQVLDSVRVFPLRITKSASSHANWNLSLDVNMKVLCELAWTLRGTISRSTRLPSDTNFGGTLVIIHGQDVRGGRDMYCFKYTSRYYECTYKDENVPQVSKMDLKNVRAPPRFIADV
jgi:hypothetical protein